jgi:hypothetical protein
MIRFIRYSKRLPRFGVTTLIFTALFLGLLFQPKPVSAGISSVGPGTQPGTVILKLNPYKQTNKFRYFMTTNAVSVPKLGGTPLTSTVYTLGSNIPCVIVANLQLIVYEVNESGRIAAFRKFSLTSNNVAAPVIVTAPIASKGTVASSTQLALVPNAAGDDFKVLIVSKPATILPATYSVAKGVAYTAGANITGVDAVKNKYIDIYEVDANGKTIAFKEILLKSKVIGAPDIKNASAIPGSAPGKTILKLTPTKTGDKFYYVDSASTVTVPATLPNCSLAGKTLYTIGKDISLASNSYLDIYELDNTNAIVAFKEILISDSNIAVSTIVNTPVALPGDVPASTKLVLTPNFPTDTFNVVISSKVTSLLPATGSIAKGSDYTVDDYSVGNNLIGVDSEKNKYIGVYEVDDAGNTVAFTEIVLDKPNLTAPELKPASISTGTGELTTKLKLSTTKAGNSFKYVSPAVVTTLPVLGTQAPGNVYASGTDLSLTVPGDIDVYEVDASNNIIAYSKITVDISGIAAPSIGINNIVAVPGSVAGSTTLALPTGSYKVLIASKAITVSPAVGELAKGNAYVLGSDITGVDDVKNKYLDIYEIDANGKTVRFIEIELTSDMMTAPDLK